MTTVTLMLAWLGAAASAIPGDAFPMNQLNFQIPIKIDATRKAEIKQLVLYSSSDLGKTWHEQAIASPDKDFFPFFAPKDGLYWFTVVVVDQQGNKIPSDVYTAPPSQKIVVDTLKPILRIVSAERQGDEVNVSWEIQEENPDLASLKLEYHSADAPASAWLSAPLTPALTGSTRFRVSSPAAMTLRLQMQDQAGNAAAVGGDVPPGAGPALVREAPAVAPAPVPAAPIGPAPGAQEPIRTTSLSSTSTETQRLTAPLPRERTDVGPMPEMPGFTGPASVTPPTSGFPVGTGSKVVATTDRADPVTPPPAPVAAPVLEPRSAPLQLPSLQIVNTRQVPIEYEIRDSGPSGIRKVELWMTKDDGATWQHLSDDADLKSPVVADLPGEGVYGFRVVVQSRAGRGMRPPVPGDLPELRVELDETAPSIQLYAPEPDPRSRDTLLIAWKVTDRNLDASPISIHWAEQREGPWKVIATDMQNTGRLSWKVTPDVPVRVFLRLTARDTAGNVSVAPTDQPVLVDMAEPYTVIKGIARTNTKP